jgi:hypothetical protein
MASAALLVVPGVAPALGPAPELALAPILAPAPALTPAPSLASAPPSGRRTGVAVKSGPSNGALSGGTADALSVPALVAVPAAVAVAVAQAAVLAATVAACTSAARLAMNVASTGSSVPPSELCCRYWMKASRDFRAESTHDCSQPGSPAQSRSWQAT